MVRQSKTVANTGIQDATDMVPATSYRMPYDFLFGSVFLISGDLQSDTYAPQAAGLSPFVLQFFLPFRHPVPGNFHVYSLSPFRRASFTLKYPQSILILSRMLALRNEQLQGTRDKTSFIDPVLYPVKSIVI